MFSSLVFSSINFNEFNIKVIRENRLIGEEDYVEFEDDDQIVRLSGDFVMDELATGCVVGIYGVQLDNDNFQVTQMIWPTKASQPTYPILDDDR